MRIKKTFVDFYLTRKSHWDLLQRRPPWGSSHTIQQVTFLPALQRWEILQINMMLRNAVFQVFNFWDSASMRRPFVSHQISLIWLCILVCLLFLAYGKDKEKSKVKYAKFSKQMFTHYFNLCKVVRYQKQVKLVLINLILWLISCQTNAESDIRYICRCQQNHSWILIM